MKLNTILLAIFFFVACGDFPPQRGGFYADKNGTILESYRKFLPDTLKLKQNESPSEEYRAWNGFNVHLDRYPNPGSRCKVIVIHGGGGNGRVLAPMAKVAFDSGCEVVAPDLPGFGLTETPLNFRMDYSEWVLLLSDLIEAEREPDKRIFLFGLSIGGMLAYQTAAENGNVDGLIVTTLADLRKTEVQNAVSIHPILRILGIPFTSWFSFATNDVPIPIRFLSKMNLITNDPQFSEVFETDPYAGGSHVTFRWLRTASEFSPKVEPSFFRVCPLLLLHPGNDPWTPFEISKPFFDEIAGPKRAVLLEGAGHFPYEEPGLSVLKEEIRKFIRSKK
ncbi:alpha/beta hydrolase [Leptospira gomenensis]|uniref:Alpha/beta hydrolase n=1 Tax=Leptospira gomenensis TaxID=2484974 RepID=A0A5F1Z234_9LEPT|nr:alpha/beta hydrolase [Leptospira gomenensis]TGK34656.1 alpha/beta hydrolase [Leptospira gomenensis]TGK38537.1 alpha/beta hydrolase [Leptospira gomenensis]TGK51047.1 alpha/beta hydrolase [Leptospira gomenensis]TGK68312.1 alpha/beta hydrolase [Leptospira gomenensis]